MPPTQYLEVLSMNNEDYIIKCPTGNDDRQFVHDAEECLGEFARIHVKANPHVDYENRIVMSGKRRQINDNTRTDWRSVVFSPSPNGSVLWIVPDGPALYHFQNTRTRIRDLQNHILSVDYGARVLETQGSNAVRIAVSMGL